MKTRYDIAPWIDAIPASKRPSHPMLRGEHDADVVIVGGGLTGCATAQACAAAGRRVILIEGDRIGQGASGRSAGLLLDDPGPSFRDVAAAHGVRSARRVFEAWTHAAGEAVTHLTRLGIRCDLRPLQALTIPAVDETLLRREHEARVAAGVSSRWLTTRQVRTSTALDTVGALCVNGAALDPYRACVGLAGAAIKKKAMCFERTRVTKIRHTRDGAEVTCERGRVRGATVIVTTGTATPEVASLRRHFTRRQAHLVLTEPLPAAIRRRLGSSGTTFQDDRAPRQRVLWTADHRALVAGADQDEVSSRLRPAALVQRTGQLMYELLLMYPAISGVKPAYGWDMTYGLTGDGLIYAGAHRNFPHHLFALGGSGDSVTGAFLAARILLRALTGTSTKDDEVFGWTR